MPPQPGLTVQRTDRHDRLAPGASMSVGRTIESELHIDDQAVSSRHYAIAAHGAAAALEEFRGEAIIASPAERGA